MPNSFPTVTNNPKAFGVTQSPVSGNNRLGVNNVQPLQNLTNPKSVGSPSANGFTMGSTNPKFTPFQPKPVAPINNPPQAIQTTATPVRSPIATGLNALGALGAILPAPSVADDFGRGLGYLANLPQIAKNYAESDRLDKLLKQKEAQAIDWARISNLRPDGPPPFQGGQNPNGFYLIFADRLVGGVWVNNAYTGIPVGGRVANIELIDNREAVRVTSATGNVQTRYAGNMQSGATELRNPYARSGDFGTASTGYIDDGFGSIAGNPVTQPKPATYPSADNWVYGDTKVQIGGTDGNEAPKQGLDSIGFKQTEPFKPLNIAPASSDPNNPRGAGLNSVNGLPTISSPPKLTEPPQNQVPSTFNKPSFTARPFVAGVSDPSERFEPRDINTGKTRAEMEEDFKKSQEQFQKNAKANEIENAKRNAQQSLANFNQLSDTPNRNNPNGVSDRQNAINNYQKSIQGDPIKEQALKEALGKTTTTQNTTPTTSQTTDLRQGLDNITQQISQIKTKVKEAICEESAPDKCIDNAAKRNKSGVEMVSISIREFDRCGENGAIFTNRNIEVLKGTEEYVIGIYDQLADIEALQCNESECYAAVPEWWQIRPEGKRPQMVIQFCAKEDKQWGSPKYSITIPHPKVTNKLLSPPLPEYEKGNFEGILRLKDNSKLIINCSSKGECERVLSQLKSFIKNEMLEGSDTKFSERNGKPVKVQKMAARFATYFERGIEDASKYKWKARFDLPT